MKLSGYALSLDSIHVEILTLQSIGDGSKIVCCSCRWGDEVSIPTWDNVSEQRQSSLKSVQTRIKATLPTVYVAHLRKRQPRIVFCLNNESILTFFSDLRPHTKPL